MSRSTGSSAVSDCSPISSSSRPLWEGGGGTGGGEEGRGDKEGERKKEDEQQAQNTRS